MAQRQSIVMADWGLAFDGQTLREGPLGGAESTFVALAEALAARGHQVAAYTKGGRRLDLAGVSWFDAQQGLPEAADLYIANRSDRLLRAVPKARAMAFWLHNPASYLLKWRYLWKLALRRPTLVFLSQAHAQTYPAWGPGGARVVIGHGTAEPFLTTPPAQDIPPARAVFLSNPLHGLDWVLDCWEHHVAPQMPTAHLELFSGAATYKAQGPKAEQMAAVLARAEDLAGAGVVLRTPLPKDALAVELAQARVLIYRGEPGEAFCLAVADAQAMGVPAVVSAVGALPERVHDGVTGFVTPAGDQAAFGAAVVRLLNDDLLWQQQHNASLDLQRQWGWDETAAAFERLIGRETE
jgi:hypothetical protein